MHPTLNQANVQKESDKDGENLISVDHSTYWNSSKADNYECTSWIMLFPKQAKKVSKALASAIYYHLDSTCSWIKDYTRRRSEIAYLRRKKNRNSATSLFVSFRGKCSETWIHAHLLIVSVRNGWNFIEVRPVLLILSFQKILETKIMSYHCKKIMRFDHKFSYQRIIETQFI